MKVFSKIAVAIALFLSTQLSAQVSVFGDPIFDQSVTQAEINNAGPVFSQQTVLFPSTQTFLFNGTSQKEIRATDHIKIQPGFKSGTYSGAGKMKLTVAPSPFDVAVMNYVDGVQHVLGYQKLELGVQLPTDINTKVANFVNGLTTNILNPYMEWDLRVYAIFTHPNEAQPIVIDGYYTKEFTSWMVDPLPAPDNGPHYQSAEYNALGGWNENATAYPFRIRFSPPRSGVWKAKIVIATQNGTVEVSSPDFEFNVFGTSNHGFVDVSSNNRYLELDGNSFYPVGCNISWPETNPYHDPELWNLIGGGEDYWTVQCRPRVYEKYRGVMSDLADNGANYLRMIMSPTGTDIEHEKLGDYTGRLHMADELDQIVELAEEKNIFLHWNFNIHFRFENCDSEHWRPWNWNVTSANGVPFCYPAEISGVVDPIDYFTNADAKKYHKQRLRYILSRWGYSTSIGAFELFSEISNVGTRAPESSKYSTESNWTIFRDWQVEMGNYIKSTYLGKQHLLTCSYSGAKALGSEGYENGAGMADEDNTFNYPCFDVMTCNVYDFDAANGAGFFVDNISKQMLNGQTQFSYVKNYNPGQSNPIIKPLLFAECEPIYNQCDPFKIELKRSLWQSMFSGLAGGFSWVDWYFPETYSTFGKMHNFISQFNLGSEQFHPGTMHFVDNGVEYSNWTHDEALSNDNGLDPMSFADLIYLRSEDKNKAIGVITNLTLNPYSTGDQCISISWTQYPVPLAFDITNNPLDINLTLKNMNWGEYRIEYYFANDPMTEIHHSDSWGPSLPIEVGFPDTDLTKAFILFKAYKLNSSRMDSTAIIVDPENTNSIMDRNKTPEASVFQIYPNPATSEIFVEIPSNNSESIVIIESLDGRVSKKLSFSENRISISISDLKPATYVVKCYSGENLVGLQKIVKL
jgi:Secretion system C-terminal sorting domain